MSNNMINLAKLLADKRFLNVGMTVSARVPVNAFGHIPVTREKFGTIHSIDPTGITAIFEGGKQRHADFEDIMTIEGMDVPRFAQAYRIKPAKKYK